jgi:D-sedoheptulose 7-phosphate isomerase
MKHLEELVGRYPQLAPCRQDIQAAYDLLAASWSAGGKLLVCGNGGSAADSDHIVGELMKGFLLRRPLPAAQQEKLRAVDAAVGGELATKLQGALPAINLVTAAALNSAFANDVSPELVYAQAAFGWGRAGDVILGISTSGNARNVRAAMVAAKASGLKLVGMTGRGGGALAALCDVTIRAPETETFKVQELHLPIYHCLCAMAEERFFGPAD